MVKKLTVKSWIDTGLIVLICLIFGGILLWFNGPGALLALRGLPAGAGDTRPASNYYILSGIGLFMLAIGIVIFLKLLLNSVRKRVNQYLAKSGGVTEAQLDQDFEAARQIGNVWLGRRWTFSHDLNCILLENREIAWVFSEKERVKNKVNYYLCLGTASGDIRRIKVSEENLQSIMEVYQGFPHILAGNNPDYGYQFRNNLQAFLELRYRSNSAEV
ncbi:MAG: hypothetical protein NC432_02590 [Roseburia sp.]|nr:hypothetical protein [Roseburia sp.]MCM1097151.1 hypothetical protein [Ruminococcus flavefaciens]